MDRLTKIALAFNAFYAAATAAYIIFSKGDLNAIYPVSSGIQAIGLYSAKDWL